MKKLVFLCACALVAVNAALADPMSACKMLVGTFAEPGKLAKPVLTVTLTNDQFTVTDLTGKKTIVTAKPSDSGLVIIEDPKDRNAFLLYFSTETGDYLFRHVGRAKDGKPLPDEPAHTKKLVKVEAPAVKSPEKGKTK
jgi:hypothetical protein